jgi:hypothetical protein
VSRSRNGRGSRARHGAGRLALAAPPTGGRPRLGADTTKGRPEAGPHARRHHRHAITSPRTRPVGRSRISSGGGRPGGPERRELVRLRAVARAQAVGRQATGGVTVDDVHPCGRTAAALLPRTAGERLVDTDLRAREGRTEERLDLSSADDAALAGGHFHAARRRRDGRGVAARPSTARQRNERHHAGRRQGSPGRLVRLRGGGRSSRRRLVSDRDGRPARARRPRTPTAARRGTRGPGGPVTARRPRRCSGRRMRPIGRMIRGSAVTSAPYRRRGRRIAADAVRSRRWALTSADR